VLGGNIADKLHNDDRFTYPGTAVGTYLTASGKRGNQVDNLESRLKYLGSGFLFLK